MFRTGSPGTALAAGTLALTLLTTACGGQAAAPPSGGASATSLSGKTIALVGYGNSNPWGAYFNKVFTERLASTGVKVGDMTTMDPGTQVQKFNQAVAQKPDLIVLAMLDTTGDGGADQEGQGRRRAGARLSTARPTRRWRAR